MANAPLPPPLTASGRPAAATVITAAIGSRRMPTSAEAAVLELVRSGRLVLDAGAVGALDALLHADDPLTRLGLATGTEIVVAGRAAIAGAARWRRRGEDPFADSTERGACDTIARTYEAIHHLLISGVLPRTGDERPGAP